MKKLVAIILLCAVRAYGADVVIGTWSELTNWTAGADRIAQFGVASTGAPPTEEWMTPTNGQAMNGETILDSAGTNDGVSVGFVSSMRGSNCWAITANGSAENLNMGIPSALQWSDNHPFTVSAWVKVTTYEDWAGIFLKNNNLGSPYTWIAGLYENASVMNFYNGAWNDVAVSSPSLNSWHLYTWCFDGATLSAYVDCELKGTHSYGYTNTPSHQFYVGAWADGTYLRGAYSDIGIFTNALEAERVGLLWTNTTDATYTSNWPSLFSDCVAAWQMWKWKNP